MTELLSSLFSQIMLMLVALVASAGSQTLAPASSVLAANAIVDVADAGAADVAVAGRACGEQRRPAEDDCQAAARMRWQVTMHLPSARRCAPDCAG